MEVAYENYNTIEIHETFIIVINIWPWHIGNAMCMHCHRPVDFIVSTLL
jgi:hypothetical protein